MSYSANCQEEYKIGSHDGESLCCQEKVYQRERHLTWDRPTKKGQEHLDAEQSRQQKQPMQMPGVGINMVSLRTCKMSHVNI